MIKLNYKTIDLNGITIYYAKYRKNRNIRLSVDGSGKVKLTMPYYASINDINEFLIDKEEWIRHAISKQENNVNLSKNKSLNSSQKKALLLRIKNFVEKYEILMNTKVNNISIRKMKTLWGSCSYIEKNIRFNSYLYYMSDYFLEYIVVHEMAHLFVHNHSPRFYEIVKSYLPDYKSRWKEHKKVSLA